MFEREARVVELLCVRQSCPMPAFGALSVVLKLHNFLNARASKNKQFSFERKTQGGNPKKGSRPASHTYYAALPQIQKASFSVPALASVFSLPLCPKKRTLR